MHRGVDLPDFQGRCDRLRARISSVGLDALLVTNETNVRYLTGFTGDSSYLLLDNAGQTILSDPRYEEQLREECPGFCCELRTPADSILDFAAGVIATSGYQSVGIEATQMTIAQWNALRGQGLELVETSGLVESLRAIKDEYEIGLIRKAVDIAERVFQSILPRLRAKWTEKRIANEIDGLIRELGGSGCSFPVIAATDAGAAKPHAVPTDAEIGQATHLLLDWGATFQGYRSDLTRVLLTSRIPAEISRGYEAVLSAQEAAIAEIRPGVAVGDIDAAARKELQCFGVADRFTHGLGHSIGLDIHEEPMLRQSSAANLSDSKLAAGMVVTVEPGVYYPGVGGIRIEDDVLVTQDGCEVLSRLPKSMQESQLELLA